jgi:hypothetical protein
LLLTGQSHSLTGYISERSDDDEESRKAQQTKRCL